MRELTRGEPAQTSPRRVALWLGLLFAVALLVYVRDQPAEPMPPRPPPPRSPVALAPVPPPPARVQLHRVAMGLQQPTDLQVPPGHPGKVVVLQKEGQARLLDLASGQHQRWFSVRVRSASEQGLLGLAFHPQFRENGRFFVHHTPREGPDFAGRITEWRCDPKNLGHPQQQRIVLEVAQPFANHNGGQLAFGPKGYLYIGFGDGGSAGDPRHHGQNGKTFLGSMLRIDVDSRDPDYGIPPDNPFLTNATVHSAAFAIGLRNPWRFSFTPDGRLVVADVGQNRWEEVNLVPAGSNLGWNVREGRHCFGALECAVEGFTEPVWEYGHDVGGSITGGYVYTGSALPYLRGRYVAADFVSGRFWALRLPSEAGKPATEVELLGKFPVMPATFGRLISGELLVADFRSGDIFQLALPAARTATQMAPLP